MTYQRSLKNFWHQLYGPTGRFYAFAAFVFIVFLTGGGSRDDIQSLAILRPLSILFAAYAITTKRSFRTFMRFPLIMLLLLSSVMLIQLIKLPPSIWTMLPHRQIYFEIASLGGLEQPWRPITLSPSSTINSLFSLSAPFAAMALYYNLEAPRFRFAVIVLIAAALASVVLALLQILGGFDTALYLYRITNEKSAVGLFANRNHQALILVLSILLLGWYGSTSKKFFINSTIPYYASIAIILLLVPLIFITGSRAGLVLMLPACAIASYFYYAGSQHRHEAKNPRRQRTSSGGKIESLLPNARTTILLGGGLAVVAMIGLSIYFSRSLALDRLLTSGGVEELRGQLFPLLAQMLKDHFALGIGFGSFEHVYKSYETISMLRPSYLNEAHSDVLQVMIEGGILAMLLCVVLLGWLFKQAWLLVRNWKRGGSARNKVLMCFAAIFLIFGASLWDYPLRVPSVMTFLAVIFCLLSDSIVELRTRTVVHKNESRGLALHDNGI